MTDALASLKQIEIELLWLARGPRGRYGMHQTEHARKLLDDLSAVRTKDGVPFTWLQRAIRFLGLEPKKQQRT